MSLRYKYVVDGTSFTGAKIPDIPTVHLTLRRKDKRMRASGTAILDTGFDGRGIPEPSTIEVF